MEATQKRHESEISQSQEKIELLEKRLAQVEDKSMSSIKVKAPSPPSNVGHPPALQPKSPTRRKKRLKKGEDSLTANNSKSELVSVQTSSPSSKKTSSDPDILSLVDINDRPKSSSYGDLTAITKDKPVMNGAKLSKTPQLSPAIAKKKEIERKSNRRESGDKLTITALVAESMINPGSMAAIRKELKSDSFTPKIKRKFHDPLGVPSPP